jgi:hypothetical protein
LSHTYAIRFGVFGEAARPLATDAAQAASRKNYAALILVCIGGTPYFLEAFLSFTLPREQRLLAARHARVGALRPDHERNKHLPDSRVLTNRPAEPPRNPFTPRATHKFGRAYL